MLTRLARLMLFLSVLCAPALAQADLQVAKIGKVFSGPEGLEVTIVPVEPRTGKKVLIYFSQVDGDYEGKVILHDENDLGDRGADYKTKYQGKDYATVVARTSWGSERRYEVYPPGTSRNDGIEIRYDEKKSKELKTADILAKYNEQQKQQAKPGKAGKK